MTIQPVKDFFGRLSAHLVSVENVTTGHAKEKRIQTISYIAAVCAVIISLIALLYMLNRSMRPLGALRTTIETIERESDLSRTLEVHSTDEVGQTAKAFNSMLDKFHHIIGEVAESTGKIATMASRTAEVSERALSGAEEQKAETEKLATAITEMSTAVKEVARNAAEAEQAAGKADSEAQVGQKVVNDTVEAINMLAAEVKNVAESIKRLEGESKNVGMVVQVINEIAFQTNLLALNASVEAARAGRHGKGFAVVAEEVRSLAGRTQKSTLQISEIVDKLQEETAEAVKTMEKGSALARESVDQALTAGKSLGSITQVVSRINEMNQYIANASEEQSAATEEINKNVEIISRVADENASGAENVSVASEDMAKLTSRLEALIAKFKV